jgi:hypothetical protein
VGGILYNPNKCQYKLYSDDWEKHKSDIEVWKRFWALVEIKRKWNWANWFYILDRENNKIVAPSNYTYYSSKEYMLLCLWISLLRSIHEGLTEKLDKHNNKEEQTKRVLEVFPDVPESIKNFPLLKIQKFKYFRNAVFHCSWYYRFSNLETKQNQVNKLDELHKNIGLWLDDKFKSCFREFVKKYNAPINWKWNFFDENNNSDDFY